MGTALESLSRVPKKRKAEEALEPNQEDASVFGCAYLTGSAFRRVHKHRVFTGTKKDTNEHETKSENEQTRSHRSFDLGMNRDTINKKEHRAVSAVAILVGSRLHALSMDVLREKTHRSEGCRRQDA